MKRVVLSLLCLSAFSLVAGAQEAAGIDELFEDPVEDTVVADIAVDHLSQYVKSDGIRVKGYFDAVGGVGAGWNDWPILTDLALGFDRVLGVEASAYISFDAQPDPSFHFYGAFSTSIDPLSSVFTWNGPRINSLFIDYVFNNIIFSRMGVYEMTWGQGRIFEGYTNLLSDLGSSFSMRVSAPTLLDGVTLIGFINTSLLNGDSPTYKHIAVAGKADTVLLDTMLSLAGRYQVYEGLKGLVSLKKVIYGIDLLADILVGVDDTIPYMQALCGFFKEWDDVIVYGEYYYDGLERPGLDHTLSLAAGFNNVVAGKIDLGIQWSHAFIDGSGVVTAGLEWLPWKYITANIAVPLSYGALGSRYVTSADNVMSGKRLALIFGLELEVNF